MGLWAILLVALAPTVSQLRAASAGAHDSRFASDLAHAAHGPQSALAIPCGHDGDGKVPDDCWKKCGYCGFLTDSPAAAGIAFLASVIAPSTLPPSERTKKHRPRDAYGIAAQPRGPPDSA